MPIQPAAQNSPIPTSGPTITLASGENMELSWQERALCAQTDPEAFFPEKGGSTREAKRLMMSASEFGAVFQNANAVASSVALRKVHISLTRK